MTSQMFLSKDIGIKKKESTENAFVAHVKATIIHTST